MPIHSHLLREQCCTIEAMGCNGSQHKEIPEAIGSYP